MEVVGQINIDFQVLENHNPRVLMLGDNSDWLYAENLASYISVRLPGSIKDYTFTWKKNSINTFNSHNLGLSCVKGDCTKEHYVDLPDGIYTICLISGFEDINKTKYYLKTDLTELELSKVIVKHGFEFSENDNKFRDKIIEVKWLILVAKSHAKLGDFVKANKFFQQAVGKFNKFKDCKDCI